MKSQAAEMDRRQTRSMLRSKRDTGKDKQLAPIDSATAARTAFTGLPRSAPYASLSAGNLLRVGYDLRQSRRVSQREGQEKRTKADLPRKRRRMSKIEFIQRDGSLHRKQITVLQTRTHRTPCQCRDICEKHCPCVTNKVCCEKFCGCSDQCEQRYRGCHCATGQCRREGCPCFVAHRECDPEICSRCWNSCGTDPQRPGHRPFDNMNIQQGKWQKIEICKSGVAGLAGDGAFIVNAVKKHGFIGEYTGELISHKVAEKRHEAHPECSYLFDLNEKFVVDARNDARSLLKYVNHSDKPNCYALVLLVKNKHRISFFAKEDLQPGSELFIKYGPAYAPVWDAVKKVEKAVGKRNGWRNKLLNGNLGPPKRSKILVNEASASVAAPRQVQGSEADGSCSEEPPQLANSKGGLIL